MLKPDHQRDAGVMQYGHSSSTAIGLSLQRYVLSLVMWSRKFSVLDGRWAGDPIEQIKITNDSIHELRRLALFHAWHPLAFEDGEGCEGGELQDGVCTFSLGGNRLSTVAGWTRCRFWFWRLYRAQI